MNFPDACFFGRSENADIGSTFFSIFTQKIFLKSAGTHTFRLEGMNSTGNDKGTDNYIYDPVIMATYFPTSYGSVFTTVSTSEVEQFDDAELVSVPDRGEAGGGETVYKVDLRELELKAKEARLRLRKPILNSSKPNGNWNRPAGILAIR